MKKKVNLVKIGNRKANTGGLETMFAGAASLMQRSESEQHSKQKSYITTVAKILKISPLGVTILGGLPYINNLGKKQLTQLKYHKGCQFRYNWVQRSINDEDKAICEVMIIQGKKELTPWIAGEASPASMKMSTLKGYQNHIAQTRAENRAMHYLDGLRTHDDLLNGITKHQQQGLITEKQAEVISAASVASAEEMINTDNVNYEIKNAPPTDRNTTLTNLITDIYTKVSNIKIAQAWLAAAKINDKLTKEEKATIINLLETKIKMFRK